jgi:MFS family permease
MGITSTVQSDIFVGEGNRYAMSLYSSLEPSLENKRYQWYMLALLTGTATFVASITTSCLPVLFKEISDDLGLSLVQIGTIWGISNLGGVFISIVAGLLSDKFGVKLVLSVFSIMVGISGALRGISDTYFVLALTVFINGVFRLVIPVTMTKATGMWFKNEHLGLAMGITSMGMGLGLTLGPMISATILSPVLGGWRNVMYFYGAISTLVGFLWVLIGKEPRQTGLLKVTTDTIPLRQVLQKIIHNKYLWLIGLTGLFRVGSAMGVTGYLPLYLRGLGWDNARADGSLAASFAISTICVVPLCFLSDRIGSRKAILFPALITSIICFALLPLTKGGTILALMLVSWMFFDVFASLSATMLLETEGLGSTYSGMAIGILLTLTHIGNVAIPPLGNSLATISAGAPFFLWSALSALALVALIFTKDTG